MVAVTVLPFSASAQAPTSVPRIGLLQWEGCPGPNSVLGRALNDLGYTWGEKIEVVCRSAEGSYRGLARAADDLVIAKGQCHCRPFTYRGLRCVQSDPVDPYRHDCQRRSRENKSGR